MKNLKFCYEKTLLPSKKTDKEVGALKAVWQRSKYWNKNQTIRVFMINGSAEERAEMMQAFSEIESHTTLLFDYVTDRGKSDIRVSFNKGWGSYSYLGTDALFIPKEEETINIGWRGLDVCRHEALHSIGALHEHMNPEGGIEWDEEQVIKDLSGAPNYWSEAEIRHNVLNKIDKSQVDTSEFDPESIMLYYFPASWTKNGVSTTNNYDFSETDIEFMEKIYGIDTISPVITLNGEENVTLNVGDQYIELGATAMDNRDGDLTEEITIDSDVDTDYKGTHFVVYSVQDAAGNKTEKIRTIYVKEDFNMREFLKQLFESKYRLEQLTEKQLIYIAEQLGISASEEDLKKDTVEKIWNNLSR